MKTSNGVKISVKVVLLSGGIFLLAAGCSKTQPQSVNQQISSSANQQIQQTSPKQSSGQNVPNLAKTTKPQATSTPTPELNFQGTTTVSTTPPVTAPKPQGLYVIQTVDGSSLNKPYDSFTAGESAIQLLKNDHTVLTVEYTGLGEMVTSIDGIKPDGKHFWEFFVNGQSSNLGASSYILQGGEKLEWKLSIIN